MTPMKTGLSEGTLNGMKALQMMKPSELSLLQQRGVLRQHLNQALMSVHDSPTNTERQSMTVSAPGEAHNINPNMTTANDIQPRALTMTPTMTPMNESQLRALTMTPTAESQMRALTMTPTMTPMNEGQLRALTMTSAPENHTMTTNNESQALVPMDREERGKMIELLRQMNDI